MRTELAVLASFFGLLTLNCLASEVPPPWIQSPPPPDAGYLYAVGLGEGASLSEATQEAKKSAWLSFAHQVVGIRGEGTEEVSSDLKTSAYQRKIRFGSDVIEFRGIEEFKTYDEEIQNGYRSYVLARIPRLEAEVIRKQFDRERKEPPNLSRVTFESDPANADLTINGTSYGATPLKVLLPPKAYVVRISRAGFRTETKNVLIRSKEDQTISTSLEPLTGTLSVKVKPSVGDIYVDDQHVGTQELESHELQAGNHKLEVKAEGYRSVSRSIAIRSERKLDLEISLKKLVKKMAAPQRRVAEVQRPAAKKSSFNDRCVRAMRKSKWDRLVRISSDWKQADPNNYAASYYQGLGYLHLNHLDEAISNLTEADRRQSHWLVLQTLCEAYLAAGKTREAESKCKASSALQLNKASTYVLLAKIKERQREYRAGYEYLKVAISLDKNSRHELNRFCEKYHPWRNVEECQRMYRYPKIYNDS